MQSCQIWVKHAQYVFVTFSRYDIKEKFTPVSMKLVKEEEGKGAALWDLHPKVQQVQYQN